MIEALVLARFAHITALSIVLGAALFPFYGLPKADQDTYQRLTWLRPLLIGAAVASWISGASGMRCCRPTRRSARFGCSALH